MSSSLSRSLTIAIRTGKVILGYKETLEALRAGKAKLVVVARNIPEEFKSKINKIAKLAKIPVVEFEASSLDLGAVCGKPYTVSALAIRDPGDSDILNFGKAGRRRRTR
ncbi:MAG: 50S ribosomal protein L30e [Candidatus Hecatellaceae archaeon]